MTMTKHTGSCHCGAVAYEGLIDLTMTTHCNCSICTKTMVTGAKTDLASFKLLRGESELSGYQFGGKVATRYFCKHCGVQCFGKGFVEELGGDFVSININTLDDVDVHQLPLLHWDGRHDNWHAGPSPKPYPIRRD